MHLNVQEREIYVSNLEKQLEEAKIRIKVLGLVEKEYAYFRDNKDKEVKLLKESIAKLQDKFADTIKARKQYRTSMEYYKRKCQWLEKINEEVKKTGKSANNKLECNSKLSGLRLVVEAARAANAEFSADIDLDLMSQNFISGSSKNTNVDAENGGN